MNYKDENNKVKFIEYKEKVFSDFEKFIDIEIDNNYKKAVNLTYWLESYKKYLKQEQTYSPAFSPIFKKGTIVQVDLGFNIGSEYGGLHYAIVINNNDTKHKPNITIIPLSSTKPNKKFKPFEVNLHDSVYKSMKSKIDALLEKANHDKIEISNNTNKLREEIKELTNNLDIIRTDSTDKYELLKLQKSMQEFGIKLDILNKNIEENENKIIKFDKNINLLENCLKKFNSMKKGSFVMINQITTISKIRIKDPINTQAPLYDIQISEDYIDKIDDNLKKYLDI